MGKQARGRARTKCPPEHHEWPRREARFTPKDKRELEREFISPLLVPGAFYVTALPGNPDEPHPRSIAGLD